MVVTVSEEPVEVKLVETAKVVTVNLLEDLKLLVVLEVQVYLVLNTLVVMVTQEVNKTLKPWTAEEVVLVTSVAKAVLLMLEVALVRFEKFKLGEF